MKKYLIPLCMIVLLLPPPLHAKWISAYDIEQSENDKVVSLVQTADTGFIVLNNDMTLLKLSPAGSIAWTVNYLRGYGNAPRQIIETADLGYLLLANHRTSGSDNCTANDKIWLIKLDQNGQILWQRVYYGIDTQIDSVTVREIPVNNGYIVAGNIKNSDIDTDIWVLRLSPAGIVSWQKTLSINGQLQAFDMLYDQTNTRIVVSGTLYLSGSINYFGMIFSLDMNGTLDWARRYSLATYFSSMIQEGTSYLAAGTNTDFENNRNALLAKINAMDGSIIWGKKYGSPYGQEQIEQLVAADGGGYAFICNTNLYGMGSYDVWLNKVDHSGNVTWGRTFGGIDAESGTALYKTADSGYITGGFTQSFPLNTPFMNLLLIKLPSDGCYDNCTRLETTAIPGTDITGHTYNLPLSEDLISPVKTLDTHVSPDNGSSINRYNICQSLDSDGDGIPDDGDNSGIAGDNPCPHGVTVNCDDNCIYDCNVFQLNHDDFADDIGDVCDRDPNCDRGCGANPCEQKCSLP